MKIKKNDNVIVLTGKDRTKNGKVVHVDPKTSRVVVEGVNVATRHIKPQKKGQKGQKVTFAAPIDVSNVQIVCPKCKKPTRTGTAVEGKGKKRVCKKCNSSF